MDRQQNPIQHETGDQSIKPLPSSTNLPYPNERYTCQVLGVFWFGFKHSQNPKGLETCKHLTPSGYSVFPLNTDPTLPKSLYYIVFQSNLWSNRVPEQR